MQDNPVYYDNEKKQLYWISWYETGNSDIPTRHYIDNRPIKNIPNPIQECHGIGHVTLFEFNHVIVKFNQLVKALKNKGNET